MDFKVETIKGHHLVNVSNENGKVSISLMRYNTNHLPIKVKVSLPIDISFNDCMRKINNFCHYDDNLLENIRDIIS